MPLAGSAERSYSRQHQRIQHAKLRRLIHNDGLGIAYLKRPCYARQVADAVIQISHQWFRNGPHPMHPLLLEAPVLCKSS